MSRANNISLATFASALFFVEPHCSAFKRRKACADAAI